jgi:hypothetical protein
MNETEMRSRLRKAMGDYDYKPRSPKELAEGLVRGAPSPHLGAMGIVAAILALLIVVSLVYVRFNSTRPTFPAASPSPSSSIPMSVLERMNIAAAGALISQPNLVGTVGDRTVTLAGAYADAFNTTLIFRVSPASNTPLGIDGWTEFGPFAPYGPLVVGPDGYQYIHDGGQPAHNPGEPARLRLTVWAPYIFLHTASDARPPIWSFTYDLKVQAAATSLRVQQGVIAVGSWRVTVLEFEMTPSTIYSHVLIDGLARPAIIASPSRDEQDRELAIIRSVAIFDQAGTAVRTGGCGGSWSESSHYPRVWELKCWWPRPAQATTYRMVITGGGGQYSTSFVIPAPPTS